MTTPSPDQIKTLEQSRQRLIQLTHSLGSLVTSLNQSDPLPAWPSLQSQASIISSNLQSLSIHLSENHDLLRSISALPAPDFPTRTQTTTLEQLLRTKLDPRVEDWVARGRKADTAGVNPPPPFNSALLAGSSTFGGGSGSIDKHELSGGDLAALWEWAPVEANSEARRRNWGGNFTLEERERGVQVVAAELGLKRVLEDDEESEEDEDEEMDLGGFGKVGGVGTDIAPPGGRAQEPVVPIDDILRYMTTGALPAVR
ncbi:RNA polymerase II mediator complex subunit MED8 [Aspergillus undulatus]|uniref:RNA polymerase II mediator complex subunit MED8 n=1 Tax=Aspergillus undulatus TaxID=1810928 RepID=UPI003CCD912B